MEVVDSVLLSQLIMNFETRLEKIFKQLELSDFPSNVGIDVVNDFGKLKVLLILLWKFAELLLFANCWSASKFWSASIVAGVFSLRICGWLVERVFFCFREDVLGEHYVTSSWTPVLPWQFRIRSVAPVTMSWPSSGPEFCVIWLLKRPASGWGLLWESSWFVPWFILNTFRDVSGAVLEWPWISGFMRKSSIRASAPSMRFSNLLKSCDNFLVTFPSISSETWVMLVSCDLGTFGFCAKLLLECHS